MLLPIVWSAALAVRIFAEISPQQVHSAVPASWLIACSKSILISSMHMVIITTRIVSRNQLWFQHNEVHTEWLHTCKSFVVASVLLSIVVSEEISLNLALAALCLQTMTACWLVSYLK